MGSALASYPLVTIGIPTRNRPEGLRTALAQATGQTYRNLEIVVSDNASDDVRNMQVAQEFAARDARVRAVRQPANIGIDANFKFLLAQAKGEYFCWAADDDERTPDFVELCLRHIGDCGSIMPGMRLAVRTRGLLRPKPELRLSPERGAYANAVAFFTNLQPSLFYGLHRTATLRVYLGEFLHDYYDCFFILRQILTHGFRTIPQVAFTIGVDSEAPASKAARPRPGALFEYWPFYSKAMVAVASSASLAAGEKARLSLLLSYVALNEFSFFEKALQPRKTFLARGGMGLLRWASRFAGVPLPPPPPTMVLPDDPGLVPYMYLPAEELESEDRVRRLLSDARSLEHNIRVAVAHLEAQRTHRRWASLPRRALRFGVRRIGLRRLLPASPPGLRLPPPPGPLPTALPAMRRELGQLLGSVEEWNVKLAQLQGRHKSAA